MPLCAYWNRGGWARDKETPPKYQLSSSTTCSSSAPPNAVLICRCTKTRIVCLPLPPPPPFLLLLQSVMMTMMIIKTWRCIQDGTADDKQPFGGSWSFCSLGVAVADKGRERVCVEDKVQKKNCGRWCATTRVADSPIYSHNILTG